MPINPMAPAADFQPPEEDLPLSTPPSPFLSLEIYRECHKLSLEQVSVFYWIDISEVKLGYF